MRPGFLPVFFMVGFALLLIGCQSNGNSSEKPAEIPFTPEGLLELVRPDGTVITSVVIEIAEGDSARARGLMERTSLPSRGGMLFLDHEARIQTFWMKNTLLPLDIMFIGADSQIVNIAKRTRPLTEDRVSSTAPAQFVLEVKAGFTDTFGIDENTRVRWRRVNQSTAPSTES